MNIKHILSLICLMPGMIVSMEEALDPNEIFQYLIGAGADIDLANNVLTKQDSTLLNKFFSKGVQGYTFPMLQTLLDAGLDQNIYNTYGRDATLVENLIWFIEDQNKHTVTAVEMLLHHGAKPDGDRLSAFLESGRSCFQQQFVDLLNKAQKLD